MPHGNLRSQCLSCFDLGRAAVLSSPTGGAKTLRYCEEYIRNGQQPQPVPGMRTRKRRRRHRPVATVEIREMMVQSQNAPAAISFLVSPSPQDGPSYHHDDRCIRNHHFFSRDEFHTGSNGRNALPVPCLSVSPIDEYHSKSPHPPIPGLCHPSGQGSPAAASSSRNSISTPTSPSLTGTDQADPPATSPTDSATYPPRTGRRSPRRPITPTPPTAPSTAVAATHPRKPTPKCPHGKRRAQCLSCFDLGEGGGSICAHRRRKDLCTVCKHLIQRGLPLPPVPYVPRRRRVAGSWTAVSVFGGGGGAGWELAWAAGAAGHDGATTHNSPIQPAADPTSDYTRRPSLPPIASWFVDPRAPSLHRSAQPQSPSPIATSLRPPPPPTPSIPNPISPAAHLVTPTHRTPKPAKPSPKCPHGKRRAQCLSCFDLGQGGGSICAHRRRKDLCGECREYVRRGFEPPPVPGARACRRGRRRARVLVPWGVAVGVADGLKEEEAGSPRKVEAATTARGLAFSVEALLGIAGGDSGAVAAAAAADGDCGGEPWHGGLSSGEESGYLEGEDDGESATPVLSPRSPPRELKLDLDGHTTIGH
ncbi:hypothetical protein DFJ73DRAFT_796962 [Zopfochytrium polystomum]|nr:hypothetical protein DFJ73DRAFT_796962 [Zopfochytrium polystomum]